MQSRMQAQVQAMIEALKHDFSTVPTTWPSEKVKQLAIKLIHEEVVEELLPAIEANDWEEIIDGACDAIWVIFYMLNVAGIHDLSPFYDEVARANMAKVGGPRDPVTGKSLKPPGWTPPDIAGLLKKLRESA